MTRAQAVVLASLVVLAGAAAVAPASAQTATVTLTVSVVTESGDAVDGARITATWENGSRTERTAGNGKAFVDVPEGATLTLSVEHPDYVRNTDLRVSNASEREVRVEVYPQGTLTLDVTDESGPVADVRVFVRDRAGTIVVDGRTDDDGTFATPAIEQDRYTVTVFKAGYFRNVTQVRLGGDERVPLAIEQGSVPLEFRVTDPHFSPPRPVSGVAIDVGDVGEVNTVGSGEASVRVPVNTDVRVSATREGYSGVERTVSVGEEATAVNLSVTRTPSLTVEAANERVVAGERLIVEASDAYGDPVEGVTITVEGDPVGETGADGTARVRLSTPGNVTVAGQTESLNSNRVTVQVIDPSTPTPTATPTATPTPTPTPTPTTTETPATGISTPGFGPLAALVALAAAAVVLALRRR